MAEEIRHPDGRIEHPEVRFEPRDASFGAIAAIMIGAIVTLALIHWAVMAFFKDYRAHLAEAQRSTYPLAPGPSTVLPAKPRLEQVDRLAGKTEVNVRLREQAKLRALNSYGPAGTKGFIHIPIERAMQMIAEKKKLPSRPAPAKEDRRAAGLVDWGESNSGRALKGGAK